MFLLYRKIDLRALYYDYSYFLIFNLKLYNFCFKPTYFQSVFFPIPSTFTLAFRRGLYSHPLKPSRTPICFMMCDVQIRSLTAKKNID